MAMGELEAFEAQANAAGATAARIARTHIYGVRYFADTNAGTAGERRTIVGLGMHTVWDGPRQIYGGAPILKRDHK